MEVTVIGLGLIGGSVGLALGRAGDRVTGFDRSEAALRSALDRGAISRAARSTEEATAGAEVVLVATPVDVIPEVCRDLAASLPPAAVVTDAGSAKVSVVEVGEDLFGDRFVGGHPMAGSERHGIEAADGHLFEDAWWIVTPTRRTSHSGYVAVTDLIGRMGAKPVAIDPAVHDALVARLSHLPQLTASALVEVAVTAGDRDALLGLAAGGFRDVTRIAASNPAMWVAVLRSNRDAVLEALNGLAGRMEKVRGLIEQDRWDELGSWLERARSARMDLFAKPSYGGEPVGLSMLVPDRPGVLAEVTTAAGQLGANIEDLRIVHSTEGGRGRLELIVAGREPAELLVGALVKLGYRPERIELEL
ncbi:MAG: prephenate dehydrogenase/arogenate dehydrogenase family protein [Actinomycetota bacterium]